MQILLIFGADRLDGCYLSLLYREFVRLSDHCVLGYRRLVSNPSTMLKLGWSPRFGFTKLAAMMIVSPAPA